MTTQLRSSRSFPVPVERAYDQVLPMPLPSLFSRRYGPISPVSGVRGQAGAWGDGVGQTRTIVLADGGTMRETLVHLERPSRFAYSIDRITGPMKPLVGSAQGAWTFEPAGTGTRVTWSWDVEAANAVGARLMPVFARLWQGFARQGLEQLEPALVG